MADTAKLSSLTAENLWVTDMTLGGLSIDDTNDFATLKINQSLDMTSGRIEAIYVTVGYAGSITPKLVVRNRIEDSVNPGFFWDADSKSANFSDASFVPNLILVNKSIISPKLTFLKSGLLYILNNTPFKEVFSLNAFFP